MPASRRDFLARDPWAGPLILGLVAGILRLFVAGPPGSTFLSVAVAVGASVPMVYRARASAGLTRHAWACFAVSLLAGSVAVILLPLDSQPSVSLARSALELSAYLFGIAGILLLARDFGGGDPDAWLDAAVIGVTMALVVLELVIPEWGTLELPRHSPLFPLSVAVVDAITFTVLARFVLRPARSLSLSGLGAVVAVVLVLDATYYATGTDSISRAQYEAMWLIAYGAWGAGAIHPDMSMIASGAVRRARSLDDDVRSAFQAIVLHTAGWLTATFLLMRDIARYDGAQALLLGLGLPIISCFTVARSIRIVRRLANDTRRRVDAEARLRESEERFRRLAEAAPVGIFVSDVEGRSIFQNEAWGAAAGRPAAEGLEHGYAASVHPDDRSRALGAWFDAVRTGIPMSIEHRLLRPDGTVAWVHSRAVPLIDDDGNRTGWVGTVADITSLKDATTAAEEREAFFNGLIEQSPIGIGVYGIDGTLIGLNPAKRRVRQRLGAALDVLDVRADPLMLQLGQIEAIERAYAGEPAAADPTTVWAPVAGTQGTGDGERVWLRFRWYPLRDTEGRVLAVISFAEDVTDAVEADSRERQVNDKIRETQKLEALGVLAGGIAHDFNNLLVPIIGYVDMALGDLPSGSPIEQDLQAARVAASRAADLARQMLAYSGRGSFAIGPASLEDLLAEIGDLMARSIAKAARLHYEFTPGLPPVLADATQLRQVALNLIVNASDALGGKPGDITLRTAMTTLSADDPDVVPGSSAEPGEYVMLEVSDTGSGMDATTRARIFDPFYSTKSMGRGLGLAATLGIVKGHGGAIRVGSVPGEGSTFAVLLRSTQCHTASAVAERPLRPGRKATGRVLLVDDELSVRLVGRRILERAGFSVDDAADGPEAIERFRANPDGFDSVLLDLTLPTLDGMSVLRELRAMRSDVPIVLCSGWSADEVAGSLRTLPRTMFLQKPYQRDALVDALSQVTHTAR